MKKLLMTFALVLFCAAPAAAQDEPTPAEMAAVRELLEASRMRENFIRIMELSIKESGARMSPEMVRVLRAFMDEHFRFDDLEPEYIRMYTALYTEEEIRGMTAFYRTPLGQRMIETLPELSAASQRIAMQRLQEHMPQLMQALMQADQGATTPD